MRIISICNKCDLRRGQTSPISRRHLTELVPRSLRRATAGLAQLYPYLIIPVINHNGLEDFSAVIRVATSNIEQMRQAAFGVSLQSSISPVQQLTTLTQTACFGQKQSFADGTKLQRQLCAKEPALSKTYAKIVEIFTASFTFSSTSLVIFGI